MPRVRVVEGTCWPCKKRRTRCDLTKPVCQRCQQTGASCDYSSKLIRWSARPSVRVDVVPALYQVSGLGQDSLASSEKRALDYFHGRVWPLLQASEDVCPPPLPVALENRVVLLATCVIAGSHQVLQEGGRVGKYRGSGINSKRLECLAAIKNEVDCCCAGKSTGDLLVLLFAVLLLHLHDGFMEAQEADASTGSHHQGVSAILFQLGGLEHVLRTGPEPMQMLLAEFVSADLTTAMLQGTAPSFPTTVWQTVDEGNVWWARDPYGRQSLASVLREMAALAFYHDSVANGLVELSMNDVRAFEEVLSPAYTPLTPQSIQDDTGSPLSFSPSPPSKPISNDDTDAVHAFALIRSFQHAALIFLYRAVCGLPTRNPLVQQHVQSCLNCIAEIERPSKVLHCVIFPLCVAGAHALSARHQQVVLEMLGYIHESMRFASVRAVTECLSGIWDADIGEMGWMELFGGLGRHVLVL